MNKEFNKKAGKPLSWLAYGGLTLSFVIATVGIGGTKLGDYIIGNYLHGATPEQTREICRNNLPNSSEEILQGCFLEKRRGFEHASEMHSKIQKGSMAALAITVPLTGFAFHRRRKINQAPKL